MMQQPGMLAPIAGRMFQRNVHFNFKPRYCSAMWLRMWKRSQRSCCSLLCPFSLCRSLSALKRTRWRASCWACLGTLSMHWCADWRGQAGFQKNVWLLLRSRSSVNKIEQKPQHLQMGQKSSRRTRSAATRSRWWYLCGQLSPMLLKETQAAATSGMWPGFVPMVLMSEIGFTPGTSCGSVFMWQLLHCRPWTRLTSTGLVKALASQATWASWWTRYRLVVAFRVMTLCWWCAYSWYQQVPQKDMCHCWMLRPCRWVATVDARCQSWLWNSTEINIRFRR